MHWKSIAVSVGLALVAIYLSNNVTAIRNIVGPKA